MTPNDQNCRAFQFHIPKDLLQECGPFLGAIPDEPLEALPDEAPEQGGLRGQDFGGGQGIGLEIACSSQIRLFFSNMILLRMIWLEYLEYFLWDLLPGFSFWKGIFWITLPFRATPSHRISASVLAVRPICHQRSNMHKLQPLSPLKSL